MAPRPVADRRGRRCLAAGGARTWSRAAGPRRHVVPRRPVRCVDPSRRRALRRQRFECRRVVGCQGGPHRARRACGERARDRLATAPCHCERCACRARRRHGGRRGPRRRGDDGVRLRQRARLDDRTFEAPVGRDHGTASGPRGDRAGNGAARPRGSAASGRRRRRRHAVVHTRAGNPRPGPARRQTQCVTVAAPGAAGRRRVRGSQPRLRHVRRRVRRARLRRRGRLPVQRRPDRGTPGSADPVPRRADAHGCRRRRGARPRRAGGRGLRRARGLDAAGHRRVQPRRGHRRPARERGSARARHPRVGQVRRMEHAGRSAGR